MNLQEAEELIRSGIEPVSGVWADIGAGSGMFTLALMEILESGKIYAIDKSIQQLRPLKRKQNLKLEIIEADFNEKLNLPPLDGIVMANALHYAKDHLIVLDNVLNPLKSNGTFILIEYETEIPGPPWIPNPVSFGMFTKLSRQVGLSEPVIIGKIKSSFGQAYIYASKSIKS